MKRAANIIETARVAVLLAAGLVVSGLAQAGEPIDRRITANADVHVRVTNVKGEIRIEAWDRDEVHLTGELGDGSRDLEVEDGNPARIRVEVKVPRNARAVEDTVLYLRVPAGASVEAESVSADIEIAGLRGRTLSAESVSGDVDVEAKAQRVELRSVSGDVDFQGSAEDTQVETVSGDIDLDGVTGDLRLTTVSGEALLRGGQLRSGRLETVSGDIELTAALAEGGELTVESLSGDVELAFPDDLSARCEVESFSGTIRSDRGEVRKARHGPQQSLEFSVGDGTGRISIESFSGDVRIRTH